MTKPQYDYEAHCCRGLQINSDHMGFFNVHLNLSNRVLFAFRLHLNAAAVAGNRTRALGLSSSTPYVFNYHGGWLLY